ncbi:MAG: mechanosensitive ion channel family protein [Aestuariivirgaceae bacterium]
MLWRGLIFWVFVAFITIGLAVAGQPASAQQSGVQLSKESIAELSDEQVRRLLLEKLSGEPGKSAGGHGDDYHPAVIAFRLQRAFGRVQERAAQIFGTIGQYPSIPGTAWKKLTQNREFGSFARFLWVLLIALAGAAALELLVRGRFKRIENDIGSRDLSGLSSRAGAALAVFITRIARAGLFVAVATAIYFVLAEDEARDRTVFVFYLSAIAVVRVVAAASSSYFAPGRTAARIPLFNDAQARSLHLTIMGTVVFGAFGFFTCALFGTLGIVGDVHTLLLISVGAMTTVLLAASVFLNRKAIAVDICPAGQSGHQLRAVCGRIYPAVFAVFILVLFIALITAAFLDYTPRFGAALFTIAVGLVWPGIDAALEREAIVRAEDNNQVSAAVMRVARLAIISLLVFLLAAAWRVDFFAMAGGGIGEVLAGALLQIAVTLFVAYGLWQMVCIWIDRKIAREDAERAAEHGGDAAELEMGGTGLSRIRTLLPLIKRTVQLTLGIIAVMIILSSLGVNIGPLLAGAGVVGLAIGFGSQTLVRDIVSGIFFLIDDAFRLGEYVDLGAVRGSVEHISIRSMRLRHHRGAVHTVPFGEIKTLTNHSRDWAIMKLKFRVPFDTDVDRVRKILKGVGQELLNHPDIKEDFIQPFKSQGAVEVDDYGFVISTKFMSKPGKQFLIRRYAFAAVQDAFAEHGIEFARPKLDVTVEDGDEPEEPEGARAKTRAAAASGGASKVASTVDAAAG